MTPEEIAEIERPVPMGSEALWKLSEQKGALLAEVKRLNAKLDQPCGSCHPCSNYADETWREAGRKPPHVYQWDELREDLAEIERLAYAGGQDAETVRRAILGVFENRSRS